MYAARPRGPGCLLEQLERVEELDPFLEPVLAERVGADLVERESRGHGVMVEGHATTLVLVHGVTATDLEVGLVAADSRPS